jgi:hypothetical protein
MNSQLKRRKVRVNHFCNGIYNNYESMIDLPTKETPAFTDNDGLDIASSPYDPAWKKRKDSAGNPFLIVVDRTGMHMLPALWCACHNRASEEMQALDMGLRESHSHRLHIPMFG